MVNDRQLRQKVREELQHEPSVNSNKIAIRVHEGVVTLSGLVSTDIEKAGAETAVWRVKGVKGIADHIQIEV